MRITYTRGLIRFSNCAEISWMDEWQLQQRVLEAVHHLSLGLGIIVVDMIKLFIHRTALANQISIIPDFTKRPN